MSSLLEKQSCSPTEALRVIRAQAALGEECLGSVRLAIDSQHVKYVTLWTKAAAEPGGEAGAPQFLERATGLPAGALDLAGGLAALLIAAPARPEDRPDPNGQSLFRLQDPDIPALVGVLRTIERYGPSPRVAYFDDRAGRRVCLLRVFDDVQRLSGISGLRRLGIFDGFEELTGYAHGRVAAFLPADSVPAREFFDAFCELSCVDGVAAAAGLAPQGAGRELCWIVRRAPGTAMGFETLRLPPAAFFDSIEVGAPAVSAVHVVDLRNAAKPADLGALLRDRQPNIGYRLRLRESRAHRRADIERERLELQRAEVTQKLAHLDSILPPRPYLLRFSQRQLAALAHTAHSFPVEAVSGAERRISYGFQATEREPGGFHYLLIQPDATRHEMDPLPLYDNDPPMKFWLDPSWARYYADGRNGCLVFVPEHTALSPSLHSWDPEGMDEYLRVVIAKRWPAGQEFPAAPYYLFDRPGPGGAELDLTVLPSAEFQPLMTRLQWINDNLSIARALDVRRRIPEAAAEARWRRLAVNAGAAADEALVRFRGIADETVREYAREFDYVVGQVKSETDALIGAIGQTAGRLQHLNAEFRKLADIEKRNGAALPVFRKLVEQIAAGARQFEDELGKIEKEKIGTAIASYERAIENETRLLSKLIDDVENRHSDLLRRLSPWTDRAAF